MTARAPLPILYSFRRCPCAMRARMALDVSGQTCAPREILLKDKPAEMIAVSPKATVPVPVLPDGAVLDRSLDIMHWALDRGDPESWLRPQGAGDEMRGLIKASDTIFKHHLDRYKYPVRHDGTIINPANAYKTLYIIDLWRVLA